MGITSARTLSAEQSYRLLGVRHSVPQNLQPADLLEQVASRVSVILGAKVVLAGKRGDRWGVLAQSRDTGPVPVGLEDNPEAFDRLAAGALSSVSRWGSNGHDWTIVGLPAAGAAVMLIEGDWTESGHALTEAALALFSPEGAKVAPPEVGLAAYHLARDLAAITGLREVCELAVRHAVGVVPCRVATFAVPTQQGNLSIVATHGYPVALTEHLRIPVGTGVIGAVYQKGAPMRVADITVLQGFERRRSRYRTNSFAALPVNAGTDVLGVLCVTDRGGDVPFSVEDVANLGVLMAPVALALSRERTQRQAHFFAQAAIVDPTSGLFNRPYFQSRLQEELQRSTRQNTPVSLLMIDIDSFKSINDTFGHLAGDAVIRDVAEILKSSVRVFDVCARYGGEEFAVVMPGSSLESATTIAERIRERIHSYHSMDRSLAGLRVTVSIGVAESGLGGTVRDVVERADGALYAAKRAGKNRVSTSPVPR